MLNHFNPRSRTGSDMAGLFGDWVPDISTHAPAQGATNVPGALSSNRGISTHAPAQGATYYGWY